MWPNPQESADLVSFTEEILNGKLRFLCSVHVSKHQHIYEFVTSEYFTGTQRKYD